MRNFFSERKNRLYLWCLWCIWVLTVCSVQLWRLNHFNDTVFDLGIYSQTLWNATHGAGWFSSIQDHSYWSDHLEPLLWLWWPVMKVWWSPLWLLWGQTLVIASSIFPLYRLARRALNSSWALAVPIFFLIHTSIWNTATVEFHVLALAFPLILWACVLLIEPRVRWWQFALLMLPLALVREEMGLVVVCFGILAAIKKKSWQWVVPAVIIGLVWTGLAHWIQFLFSDTYRYAYYFPWIDLLRTGQWRDALAMFLQFIFRVESLRMLLEAILAFGVVWLFSVEWLLPALPVVGSFLVINANVSNALVEGYHATVPIALIFVALPFGVATLHRYLQSKRSSLATFPLGLLLCVVGLVQLTTWYALWSSYPSQASQYQPDEISVLLQPIQPSDGVAASAEFLPLLGNRHVLQSTWYVFRGRDEFLTSPYTLSPEVKWIVFDTNEFLDQRTQKEDFFANQQQFLELLNTQFMPVGKLGSVLLYQRVKPQHALVLPPIQEYQSGTPDEIPAATPDAVQEFVVPGGAPRLIGNHLLFDFYLREPERWRQLEEQHITPIIRLTNGDQELTLPLAYGQVGPNTMQAGDRVVMDVVLPERLTQAGQSNSELQIIGELVRLEGVTYGRHASVVERTSWVETFLDKTVPLQ